MHTHLKAVSLAVATLVAGSFGAVGNASAQSNADAATGGQNASKPLAPPATASTALSTVTVQGSCERASACSAPGALGAMGLNWRRPSPPRQVDAEDLTPAR